MITKLLLQAKKYALPLLLLYVLAITVLSLISIGNLPGGAPEFSDKILHAGAYGVFTVLFHNYLTRRKGLKHQILVLAIPMCYGTLIEFLQYFLNSERTFDPWDIVANGVGIVIAVVIIRTLETKLN